MYMKFKESGKSRIMAAFVAQQAAVCRAIASISGREELYNLMRSIDVVDLQNMLREHVNCEESNDKMSRMFQATRSLPNRIGMDCMEHITGYLDVQDLAVLSSVSTEYHALCDRSKRNKLEKIFARNLRKTEDILNDPHHRNDSLPFFLRPFPHGDPRKIDIRTIEEGDEKTFPYPFATVSIQYTAWHDKSRTAETGEWVEFISSQVFETQLGNSENVIGLEQAVLTMSLNEKVRVWVPTRLAYGSVGADPLIPPNANLVFELKLHGVGIDPYEDENATDGDNQTDDGDQGGNIDEQESEQINHID